MFEKASSFFHLVFELEAGRDLQISGCYRSSKDHFTFFSPVGIVCSLLENMVQRKFSSRISAIVSCRAALPSFFPLLFSLFTRMLFLLRAIHSPLSQCYGLIVPCCPDHSVVVSTAEALLISNVPLQCNTTGLVSLKAANFNGDSRCRVTRLMSKQRERCDTLWRHHPGYYFMKRKQERSKKANPIDYQI